MSLALAPAPDAPSYDWRGLEALVEPLQRYLAKRCLCAHDVQDVVQETLLRAARYRHTGVAAERLRSWTLSIAANVLRDQGRRKQRAPSVGHEDVLFQMVPGRESEPGHWEPQAPVCVAERMVEVDQVLVHLRGAMTHLSQQDRVVLASFYAPGGTTRDAALALCLKTSVIKVRLFRARQRLRRRIEASLARSAQAPQVQTCS